VARYTDEQAKEILRRAIERDAALQDGLSEGELIEAARELGIDPEHVERAAVEVREQTAVEARRRERRRRERQRFAGSLATYAVVNAFLALLDFMTGPGWWVQWPLLVWGLFLALNALKVFSAKEQEKRDDRAERKYKKQMEKERQRRARLEARRARSHAESEFEQAVERGVAALLGTLAQSLDEIVPGGKPRREGEFARYVKDRKRADVWTPPPPREAPASGPRARVDVPADQRGEPEEEPAEERRATSPRSRNPR